MRDVRIPVNTRNFTYPGIYLCEEELKKHFYLEGRYRMDVVIRQRNQNDCRPSNAAKMVVVGTTVLRLYNRLPQYVRVEGPDGRLTRKSLAHNAMCEVGKLHPGDYWVWIEIPKENNK